MNLDTIIRAIQKELGVDVDGYAGPETWTAIYNRILPRKRALSGLTGKVDERSERVIATLLPKIQPYARALIAKAAGAGITIKVISGLRSFEEQNELYAKGRTKPGDIVTKARGGHSTHNFGIAFDVGVFEGGKYVEESPKYQAVGVLGMDLGLEWGGNWKGIQDEPHFQLRPSWAADLNEREMLAKLRSRKEPFGGEATRKDKRGLNRGWTRINADIEGRIGGRNKFSRICVDRRFIRGRLVARPPVKTSGD